MYHRHQRHQIFLRPRFARPFRRGDFKYLLLRQLKDKPSYGYEIMRTLQERLGSFYTPSPGSIYPTLQMLEEIGYVSAKEQEGKKVYTITNEGIKYLDEQREFEVRVTNRIRKWWNAENTDDIRETMREFGRLAELFRDKARTANSEKLSRIRKAIASAYGEIAKE